MKKTNTNKKDNNGHIVYIYIIIIRSPLLY